MEEVVTSEYMIQVGTPKHLKKFLKKARILAKSKERIFLETTYW